MNFEIDVMAIGDATCGDAFLMRFGYLDTDNKQNETVILIDGGYAADWKKIKDHSSVHYGHSKIDVVISTHPDQDHINGLKGVLENMTVGQLWIHLPWNHSDVLAESKEIDFTAERIHSEMKKSLQKTDELSKLAKSLGISVIEPFSAETTVKNEHVKITIVGPSKDYYQALLPQFLDWVPKETIKSQSSSTLERALQKLAGFVDENFGVETLKDKGDTSPQNNSSAIVLIEHGGLKFLFTGDAGREALELAGEELEFLGHEKGSYDFIQVPHHGSRHNVGPKVLDMIIGEKLSHPDLKRGQAYVSTAKNCEDHPKKVVLNAFRRRGYPVVSTDGVGKLFYNTGKIRVGYEPSTPHPLYTQVETD